MPCVFWAVRTESVTIIWANLSVWLWQTTPAKAKHRKKSCGFQMSETPGWPVQHKLYPSIWQRCWWTLARWVILISQCCNGAASLIAHYCRLLRNSSQKGDPRKSKILPWQLWYYIFLYGHIFSSSLLSHFLIRIRLLRRSFLIPFGPYFIPCLLNICNWGGSQLLVRNAGWAVHIFAHWNDSWFAVEAGLYTKICYSAWLPHDALLRFPVPHLAVSPDK